jgi:hypothetical protein
MDMPQHEGYPVAPRSRADIVEAAAHARRVLNLPDGRINIPLLLDKLTEYGLYYDVFDSRSSPMPRQVEACYYPEERTLYIRDTVYEEMKKGGQRAVFTFGHELGHAVLGHRQGFNRQVASVPRYCHSEWQANEFSAEFTMPRGQIQKHCLRTAEAIAAFFGVSLVAARVRRDELSKRGEL